MAPEVAPLKSATGSAIGSTSEEKLLEWENYLANGSLEEQVEAVQRLGQFLSDVGANTRSEIADRILRDLRVALFATKDLKIGSELVKVLGNFQHPLAIDALVERYGVFLFNPGVLVDLQEPIASVLGGRSLPNAFLPLEHALMEERHEPAMQTVVLEALKFLAIVEGHEGAIASKSRSIELIHKALSTGKIALEAQMSAVYALEYSSAPSEIFLEIALGAAHPEMGEEALNWLSARGAWKHVIQVYFEAEGQWTREAAVKYILRIVGWRDRMAQLLEYLAGSKRDRNSINIGEILGIVMPATPEEVSLFREYLIKKSIGSDPRLVGILAALLVTSVAGDQYLAGAKITQYQEASDLPDTEFRVIRLQVGGVVALDEMVRRDLREQFQNPIKVLNDLTKDHWETTIKYAQQGFKVRMIMSEIVFGSGVCLLVVSALWIIFGGLTPERLLGPGVTLAAGLGAMLAIIYTGPLKDIKQSVTDLSVASAVFIGYVHRVLEISHTFSFAYLEKKMTYAEMERSSNLIRVAMQDMVDMLPFERKVSSASQSSLPPISPDNMKPPVTKDTSGTQETVQISSTPVG